MSSRFEDPYEDPDEEPDDDLAIVSGSHVPVVGAKGRDWEYRTETLTEAEVADGETLVDRLGKAASEGWDFLETIAAGDRTVLLYRKPKLERSGDRRVGFVFGSRS